MNSRYNIKNDKNIKTYICFNPIQNNNLDDVKIILENYDKISIYPDNEDENVNTYKNVAGYIYRIIEKSKFFCKGLNPSYILDSFNNVDAVIVIGSSMDILPNGNIFGFALIVFDEINNTVYIDVICSHIGIQGVGDFLIKAIQNMCKELLISKIYLTSVKNSISFYEKYGFIKTDKYCENMCEMIKIINTNGGKKKKIKIKSKKIKTKRKSKKTRRISKK